MNKCPEKEHIINHLDLKRSLQKNYDRTRQLAQEHKWQEHVSVATPMIPALHYLGYSDWVSRMLGRLAWSYIRLKNFDTADNLLKWAEEHDKWQAAANYYWAAEYSIRGRKDDYADKCLEEFKRIAYTLGIIGKTDLEQVVNFYEKLQEVEKNANFYHSNNKSNKGRYLELKARLEHDDVGFRNAAKLYSNAKLEPYAACCKAFSYLIIAQKETNLKDIKRALDSSYKEIVDVLIFEDSFIKELLIKFIETRIALCELMIILSGSNKKRIIIVEDKFQKICENFFGYETKNLSKLAQEVGSFSITKEWDELEEFIKKFQDSICSDSIQFYMELNKLFNSAQSKLPSYSFLIFKS